MRGLYRQLAVGFTRLRNAATGGRLNPEMTLQEFEIACMARQGLRNAEIAERLNVTESTVKKYFMRCIKSWASPSGPSWKNTCFDQRAG